MDPILDDYESNNDNTIFLKTFFYEVSDLKYNLINLKNYI